MKTRSITRLLIFVGLCAISSAGAQEVSPEKSNYALGVQAFKDGDYRSAFDAWSLGAYEENPEAQYNLGVLYLEGRGVERNLEQARNWFLKAANKNQVEAQYNLGHMALSGIGMEKDTDEALRWWKKAATGGYPQAQFNYGRALYLGIGDKQDIGEGLRLIRLAASQQDARAQEFLDTSAEEIAAYEKTKVTVAAQVDTDISKPVPEPTQSPTPKPDKQLETPVKSAQGSENAQQSEPNLQVTKRKTIKLAPKKQPVAQVDSTATKPSIVPKPKTRQDQIDANNQVVALDPLPTEKRNSTLVPKKREVPVSENQVIALDKPEPVAVPGTQPTYNEDTMIRPTRPKQESPKSGFESKVQIVRDTSPIQRDYFLRTINAPVKVYAQADMNHELDTLLPRTLVKVIAKQGSKLQIEIAPGLPAWVKRVEVQLQDGYASAAHNSVLLHTVPDGLVIGELPTEFKSLIIEQRRKWLKLRVPQSVYGWIDGHALADSGESAHELMVEWVRSSHAVIGAAKRGDLATLPQTTQVASKLPVTSESVQLSSKAEAANREQTSASEKIMVMPVEGKTKPVAEQSSTAKLAEQSGEPTDNKVIDNPVPTSVDGHPVNDNKWLFSQPQGAYLIHLFTVLDHNRAKQVAQNKALRDLARLYTTRIKDEDWSFVLLGAYPDEQSAKDALKSLPKSYTKHARARLVSLLASNRCKKQDTLSAEQAKDLAILCP